VFIPLIFMGGIVGRLFREFAMTVTTAVFIMADSISSLRDCSSVYLPAIAYVSGLHFDTTGSRSACLSPRFSQPAIFSFRFQRASSRSKIPV
jgi:hypothetical protein